jgi:ADP-ribose pyrophosphatase
METNRAWETVTDERDYHCRVFDVRRSVKRRGNREHEFFVLDSPDWVNIIPIDERGDVIMIEQFRHGSGEPTLEIPGGMIDPEDDTPRDAACRELREETGYHSARVMPLGIIHPNPALQRNHCHSFLALDARRISDPSPDDGEDIIVRPVPLARIPSLIRSGVITHALVVVAFSFLAFHFPELLRWTRPTPMLDTESPTATTTSSDAFG